MDKDERLVQVQAGCRDKGDRRPQSLESSLLEKHGSRRETPTTPGLVRGSSWFPFLGRHVDAKIETGQNATCSTVKFCIWAAWERHRLMMDSMVM